MNTEHCGAQVFILDNSTIFVLNKANVGYPQFDLLINKGYFFSQLS
jgi:hypothetical protein